MFFDFQNSFLLALPKQIFKNTYIMKKIILLFAASFLMLSFTHAQKIKVTDGDLSFLKDLAELSVVFEYPDDIKVGKMSQEDFIDKKVAEKEEKEAGTGEAWKEAYFADRTDHYEPMFIELFDKYTGDLYIQQDDPDYKYTMIVKTTFMEPGYNVGISSKKAAIDLEISFIETANPENVLGTISLKKSPGTAHYDQGLRVGESYAKAGKELGKYLEKKFM